MGKDAGKQVPHLPTRARIVLIHLVGHLPDDPRQAGLFALRLRAHECRRGRYFDRTGLHSGHCQDHEKRRKTPEN